MAARLAAVVLVILAVASAPPTQAQSMYKYLGENGEWIYSDRPPGDGGITEVRDLEIDRSVADLDVSHGFDGRDVVVTANNRFFAPMELGLEIRRISGMQYPDPDLELRWVLPPRSETELLRLPILEDGSTPFIQYQYRYLPGDPNARHTPRAPYRAPFAIATNYPVTQAYPQVATHTTRDSYHAVDLAMPVGTDIFAARDGVVFDVAGTHFKGGLDPERDGPNANVVRILHDDGTYAIYAHLNTHSIRVRPGDRVHRGQYIADSGNTGFSSGPHLHFVVVRNTGMQIESVPVTFLGQNSTPVVASSGSVLTAY